MVEYDSLHAGLSILASNIANNVTSSRYADDPDFGDIFAYITRSIFPPYYDALQQRSLQHRAASYKLAPDHTVNGNQIVGDLLFSVRGK